MELALMAGGREVPADGLDARSPGPPGAAGAFIDLPIKNKPLKNRYESNTIVHSDHDRPVKRGILPPDVGGNSPETSFRFGQRRPIFRRHDDVN